MKILINAFSARLGGGQTYLINLLDNLPDDENLEIFLFAPDSLVLPQDKRITRMKTKWPTENPLARVVWEKFVLPRILLREKIDVLFCPGGVLSTSAPAECRTVTMFRNMMPFDMRARRNLPYGMQRVRHWILERVLLKSMASADLVIFISKYARSFIESKIPIRNAITIPHGIPDIFRSCGKNLQRSMALPDGEYLLYVSRFDVYKHQRELIEGYSMLPDMLRERYKLVLIGEDNTPDAAEAKKIIQERNLYENIYILGALDYKSLPSVYKHASLILFASSCENCPNILLEAMGAGRPILCSSIDPMPEFGGDAVVYFDPLNPAAAASAMNRTLSDEELRDRLGKLALKRSEQYDWKITAKVTWNKISSL